MKRSTQLFIYCSASERSVKCVRPALKMETSKEEQRGIVRFLADEGAATRHKVKTPQNAVDGIILLHDNPRPHTAYLVRDKLQNLVWETLQHPPYSPDNSHCGFQIFGDLKKDICGRRFHLDEEVKVQVRLWIHQRPTFSTRLELIVSSPSGINVLTLLAIKFQ